MFWMLCSVSCCGVVVSMPVLQVGDPRFHESRWQQTFTLDCFLVHVLTILHFSEFHGSIGPTINLTFTRASAHHGNGLVRTQTALSRFALATAQTSVI